mmetsp:Transcript_25098/g.28139  ORF Transcript_25098/g.28139 Transcript_25098/m.28139 type:complete len:126 (+) Transcript_25098:183-560(+)|eukprot:CAMPEP_0170772016 /NCGR_PEP_ID=MMETSP0733-20121128/8412_1 /TAXON_ID=186038 /ORGANISM="Fragilariopsis kerguelensis, Strain L26-C5" /LENGTH=125 /DNA_ID=CAMNT_0011113903 /DNA_START=1251 /DNA_END=1628 /DNA_ORIENTATION=-
MSHKPTEFFNWGLGKSIPKGNFYDITMGPTFEPYVLGYRHGLPRYWDSFRGYGFNKMSWFKNLDMVGYKFCTLLDYWVIHLNHNNNRRNRKQHEDWNRPHWKIYKKYHSNQLKNRKAELMEQRIP